MELSLTTIVEVQPNCIIYRTPKQFTTIIVRVWLFGDNPRIMAYAEDIEGTQPVSLFLSEILFYIDDAKKRKIGSF